MTQINLPRKNVTGPNLWSQVEDNDDAIADVVNGNLDDGNIKAAADINASKLLDGSITAAKIGNDQVTTAKIGNDQVTTAKIGNDQVTAPKLDLTIASDATNSQTTATTTAVNISGLSVSLEAGTYLLFATTTVGVNNAYPGRIFLYNQTDSAQIGNKFLLQRDDANNTTRPVSLIETVVLTGTKTIGVRIGPDDAFAVSLAVAANSASITAIRIG